MLGRYSLGKMTLTEKGEAVRWGGFTVAGLALLAIPVIMLWPVISPLWRHRKWIRGARTSYKVGKTAYAYSKAVKAKA